ncbi:WGR domain-containing protein [Rhizobium sp. CSW-27]|uniref:WGR domain-containing protein n=1 Tax=Rhizobium sp. CSW-27 TaxID=2839985 RepID=UPI001C01253C|nr:WGR domain-containing protein [Rhizobium sp. CSW-27]MBT9371633.1 WGR domain-containing protein [Rhizobium sp. CSW-27]
MGTHFYQIHIERIDPQRNMARYYHLAIAPTLFGDLSVIRTWGRIGTRGQTRVHVFAREQEAVGFFLKLLAFKKRRGYKPSTPENPRGLPVSQKAAPYAGMPCPERPMPDGVFLARAPLRNDGTYKKNE